MQCGERRADRPWETLLIPLDEPILRIRDAGFPTEPSDPDPDHQNTATKPPRHHNMIKPILALSSILMTGSLLAGTPTQPYAPPAPEPAVSLLNYNTIELGWIHTEWDIDALSSSDGAAASFSYSPFQSFYMTAGGAWESVDVLGESADLWRANAGLGGYFTLGGGIDFVAEGGAAFYGYDNARSGSDDGSSAYAKPHFRGRWGAFETHVGAAWTNLDISNEWAGFARFYVAVMENVDLSAGISAGSEEYTINAGLRFRY